MYGFVCKILLDSAGFFRYFKVNFNLQKTSAEVNSVYFPSLISLECFWLLDYFIQVRQSTPLLAWFVLKNIAFGPWSRYRKILSAFVANLP